MHRTSSSRPHQDSQQHPVHSLDENSVPKWEMLAYRSFLRSQTGGSLDYFLETNNYSRKTEAGLN